MKDRCSMALHIDDGVIERPLEVKEAIEGIRRHILAKVTGEFNRRNVGELTWVTFLGRERARDTHGLYVRRTAPRSSGSMNDRRSRTRRLRQRCSAR